MLRLIAIKLLRLVPVLFIVSVMTFLLLQLVPGDPALSVLGDNATPEDYELVREKLGLNEPLHTRYLSWLGDALTGDLGEQLTREGTEVTERIQQHLPITLQIAVMGMAIALLVSIPMGVWTAYRANSRTDKITGAISFGIISIPSFLAGLLLIFFLVFNQNIPRYLALIFGLLGACILLYQAFKHKQSASLLATDEQSQTPKIIGAVALAGITTLLFFWWPDFPRQGFVRITSDEGIFENLRSASLPAITVALTEVAVFTRLLRSDMITTLREDYILSARAKGMPTRRILFNHALRPSSFSLITLAGVAFGRLIGGTIIVETIFNLPGMGRLLIDEGIGKADYTVVQGGVLVLATFYVILNIGIDISYVYLDPRIRRGMAGARANV